MDKAGAYGVQGLGGKLVSGIKGEYYNVAGFPLALFSSLAGRFGIPVSRKRVAELLATRMKF